MNPPGRKVLLSLSKRCFQLKTLKSRLYCNKPIREKKKSLGGPQTKDKYVVNNPIFYEKQEKKITHSATSRRGLQANAVIALLSF